MVFAFKSQICFQDSSLLSTQFRKMLLDPYFLTTQVPSTTVQLVSWAHSLCITWLPPHGGLQAPPGAVSVSSSDPSLDTADSGTDTWVKLDSSEFSWQTYLGQREISFLLGLGDLGAGSYDITDKAPGTRKAKGGLSAETQTVEDFRGTESQNAESS